MASVACWVLLSTSYSVSNAQVDQTTGNLINNNSWSGVGAYAPDPGGCCTNPAGSQPLYDTTTNTIKFSFGQATVQQSIAVNQALANAGTGISVNGYSWGYDLRNMNGRGGQGGVDSLTVNTWLRDTSGQNVLGTTNTFNTQFDWTSFSGTQVLTTPIVPSNLSTVGISFTGRDAGFWAGLYGPEVRNVSLRLNYGVDPCAANPAYSPNCAGFSSVVETANQVPNPGGYTYGGGWVLDNSFAINKGLEMAGSTLKVHGFKWGYVANANGPYCAGWFLWCFDERFPSATTSVNITNKAGASIYSIDRTYTNSYNTTSYQYVLPSSQSLSTLGNFNFTASTNDQAYVGSMWAKTMYTPDQCMLNPLSSTTCPGYADAYKTQQCTANPLYASDCPGYAEAYKTQQCSLNPLYATDCPGYAAAYKSQQCSSNPLYATDCPGYGKAMLDKLAATTNLTASNPTTTTLTTGPETTLAGPTTTTEPLITNTGATTTTATTSPTTSSTSSVASVDPVSTQTTGSPVSSSSVTSASTTSTPSATNPQPRIGEVTTSGSQPKAVSSVSTSQILSIVSNEQSRISKLETSAAQAATAQAQAAGEQAVAESQAVAGLSIAQSGTALTLGIGPRFSTINSVALLSSGVGLRGPETSTAQTLQTFSARREVQEERPTNNENRDLTNNPINNILNQSANTQVTPVQQQPTGPAVKRNVKDNDAAGGVTLASIARQPIGFEAYMGVLQDRPFYPPKEIYRGQRVVDNARAQRALSGASDRLHQQMVDQQYNLGQ